MKKPQASTGIVQTIFVGKTQTLGQDYAEQPMDRKWTTAIFKKPVQEPIFLGITNLAGDQQADLKHHGGPEKAIFSYPSEHYLHLQKDLNHSTIQIGGMGENFSTIHMLEKDVAIGDIFKIGNAIIQVSQPRQPCWKPARRHRIKKLAILLQDEGRTGWYYRVIEEGVIEMGQSLQLLERVTPEWTVEKCNEIMHLDRENFERAAELSEVQTLAINWRTTLQNRVLYKKAEDIERRVYGSN